MKKIRLLFFTLFICLILINGVSAAKKITCEYSGAPSGGATNQFEVTIEINGDVSKIEKVIRKRYNRETNKTTTTDVTDSYKKVELNLTEQNSQCPESSVIFGYGMASTSDVEENTGNSQCYNYKSPDTCKNSGPSGKVVCVWEDNEDAPNGGFCNVDNLLYVGCGGSSDIPTQIPAWISFLVNLLKIATPIILIFVSLITLVKALASSKEDEIKKAQSSLIKKIIAAVMIFFVIAIVQFVISKVADDDEYQGFTDCMNCFLNNKCSQGSYYRTVVGGEDYCTPLTTGKTVECDSLFK